MKLADWPSIRLVIPLAGGIILSDTIQDTGTVMAVAQVAFVFASALTVLSFIIGGRLVRVFGLSLSLCFFSLGAWLYGNYRTKVVVEWQAQISAHCGILTDWPQEKTRSYRLDLELLDSACYGRNVIMYVPKDSAAASLEPGACVMFSGVVEKPHNDESLDFDYASYLYRHNVSGTLWVNSAHWKQVMSAAAPGLRIRAVQFRRHLVDKLGEWGLKDNALAVTAAVSLGEKRNLDSGLKQTYSVSGASHVLAVSGLHVGIMCWFLGLLVPSFLFPYRLLWLRELVIMGIMWVYAFAIGMPLSITRSLIMFTMLAFCRSIVRDSSSVNTLAFAALVMLVTAPQGLFDMSFQLSFCAVLAILLFEPMLRGIVEPHTAVGKYLWGIVTVSLAAQIGTAPILMYNFSNFSTYFLLTNLFVIPLMFVVVCTSMSLWVVGWIAPLRVLAVRMLTFLVGLETGLLEMVVALPHSSLDVSLDSPAEVWTVYAVIIALWLWLKERRTYHIVRGLAAVSAFSIWQLLQNFVF